MMLKCEKLKCEVERCFCYQPLGNTATELHADWSDEVNSVRLLMQYHQTFVLQ